MISSKMRQTHPTGCQTAARSPRLTMIALVLFWTSVASADTYCITTGADLNVNNGTKCELKGGRYNFSTVNIDGHVTAVTGNDGVFVEINCVTMTIGVTGHLDANGQGSKSEEGPGKGNDVGSGAGHGGRGGMSKTGYLTSRESVAYGSTTKPDTAGSGGGGGGGEQGGRGGGVLHLVIGKELRVYGVVSADGTAATGSASGGGSGGSIYISTDVFTGNGTVSTNGGEASSGGGGGGGGRVTIFVTENAFTGQLQSFGGKIEQDGADVIGEQAGLPGKSCSLSASSKYGSCQYFQ